MINDILKKIEQYNTIVILRHQNPDPDAIGSQAGLSAILQEVFPQKKFYITGTDLSVLDWIGKMQDIPDELYKDSLVIAVDTANARRIDNNGAYKNAKEIIKIDHHPNVDPFGDINWVDASFSSCAEMIFSFTEAIQGFQLTKTIAEKLYAGIIGDTVRFLNGETSYRTLLTSAKLAKTGIDISKISLQEDEMSLQVAHLEAYILNHLKITDSGFGYIVIRKDILEDFNLDDGEIDHVVPLIGRINKVNNWIVVSEKDLNRFRINLRSKCIPINGVAEEYGGGGHPLASGTYVDSIDKVKDLISDMDKLNQQKHQ
ncbi:bifunctional oligoribonuclease/PAP phosphatase NrnA [Companilactobacillus alimentarius]|uniref:Phosphoesterase n=1 Tax=Companilactobacillus alimentarius DSM 20249 TaxID=1423720 RepID=A0A2K9HI71_9LACO|nr:bifunctional oligoribonuclease/PAP phosphatase NrnA [Companilactobacillus alimentarius]AUI72240.1 phosphoesterase [Companilactobacillus alimentarius DSM 20249]KRK77537.1 phosphoesterase domain-containing protein [Companilactobacillus alimentarius DSM 20249]MDT6952811.1 bifunctional oligoribonuclease/PAP phosphatase NrnA [Companilactobacillus alimentarius]GEO45464.1 phosphoesterase [Companilactobacillus alimentarius]